MKTIKQIAAVTALIATPLVAFAQTDMPMNNNSDSLTRAQVKQDQMQVEQAGYNPSVGDQASYPRQVQAAEARVGAAQVQQAESGGYGGVMPGTSASGAPDMPAQPAHTANAPGVKPVYFGQ